MRRASARCSRACTSPAPTSRRASRTCAGWRGGTRPCRSSLPHRRRRRRPRCSRTSSPTSSTSPRRRPTRRCRAAPIHADLFRDNVMFDGRHARPACSTSISPASTRLLFDIAVVPQRLVHRPRHAAASTRSAPSAFVAAYDAVRPLERRRAAAAAGADARRRRCASGLSRLWDLHLPRDAAVLDRARPDPLRARAARSAATRPGTTIDDARARRTGRAFAMKLQLVAAAPGRPLGAPGLRGLRAPADGLRRPVRGRSCSRCSLLDLIPLIGRCCCSCCCRSGRSAS